MALGRIAFEPVDETGLGSAEGEPVGSRLLQRDEELPTAVHRLLVEFVPPLELGLERELAAQRMVSAPLAPDGDVRFGGDPLAEIQYPQVLKHLLDDSLVHQFDPTSVGDLQCRQGRERARQGSHGCAIALSRLVQEKLYVVREQQPVSTHLILQRQGLRLELDPVITGDVRPHVQVRSLLHVRVAELENDFRFARREAIFVRNAPSQDERMVVEPEVGGVQEEHFPDLGLKDHTLVDEPNTELLRRARNQVAILEEDFCGRKTVGLQDELALEIVNLIEWTAVAVLTLFEVSNPSWPRFVF